MQAPKPNTGVETPARTFKVDRRAAIHGEMKRQHDERQRRRRNEAIHPAHPFPVPQARDDRDGGRAPSHDRLREPLEQPGMHGQARGAGIAPAAATTMRAPPPRHGSLTSASRLHARGKTAQRRQKKGDGGAEETCNHHKAQSKQRALAPFFLFCLTNFAYTARDSNQETEKRIRRIEREGAYTAARWGTETREREKERERERTAGRGKQRSSAVAGTGSSWRRNQEQQARHDQAKKKHTHTHKHTLKERRFHGASSWL